MCLSDISDGHPVSQMPPTSCPRPRPASKSPISPSVPNPEGPSLPCGRETWVALRFPLPSRGSADRCACMWGGRAHAYMGVESRHVGVASACGGGACARGAHPRVRGPGKRARGGLRARTSGCTCIRPLPWCCRCCRSGSCFPPPASPSARWPAASPGRPRGSGWWPSRPGYLHQETGGHLRDGGEEQSHNGPHRHLPKRLCPAERIQPSPRLGSAPTAARPAKPPQHQDETGVKERGQKSRCM